MIRRKRALFVFLVALAAMFVFLFVGKEKEAPNITWGVNFAAEQAKDLGLDWKETYLALLDDLGARELKIAVPWDELEPGNQEFFFEDLDWQMEKAQEHGAKVLLAVGMKTPRWPECHIPSWAAGLPKEELRKEILEMLEAVVARYREHPALSAWQVENEPLFPFGECPWRDFSFLKKEVELVQSLDSGHGAFTSEAGELPLWWDGARLGDKVAVTMYRKIWFEELQTYLSLPFAPSFYARKAWLADKLFGAKVLVGELQAEPWVQGESLREASLAEQEKTMTLSQFQDNIAFARATGLDTFYLWGAEWWYFMKEKRQNNGFWEEGKRLFEDANEDSDS